MRPETPRARDEEVPVPADGRDAATEAVAAWEMIEAGRYRPRRIRGSFRGRELG